ncbi:hypothetical protein MPRM_48170 [Mycobacterium parmense]|uniref:SSD domain-containing protein n=1 Tax=Mycobacterium parmense TaxID=185642 RepID=A0A7I7Z0C2_9MYCO|nr:hypothetical protein MPRM_48170 [Mycobacterium parmense]
MLLWVYRSIITVFSTLFMVVIEVMAARGVVAFLAYNNIMGLSTFAVNILVLLAIAAGTDYAIFILGRYQEARGLGEDREKAFYTMFHGTAHVVLGSGLTIAGAMYCLSFTRLPYFQTMGIPCAVGMLVAVAAALTLGPAVLTVGSFFKLFDPKRKMRTRDGDGWAPRSCAGPGQFSRCQSRSPSSVYSPYPVIKPITTTGCIYPRASPRISATPPPNGISPRPG